MRAIIALAVLFASGCGPVAAAAAIASSAVSRAQGGCYAQCIAGTVCDGASGMCVARHVDAGVSAFLPAPLPEAAPVAAAEPSEPPPTALGFTGEGVGFDCRTRESWSDEVLADTLEGAERVCAELNGQPCSCARSARAVE